MTVIAFTSCRYKSLADNSLQATITIEPKDALAFVQLFGAAGTPGAVARLTPEAALQQAQTAQVESNPPPTQEDAGKEEKSSIGPLCKWCVMRCGELQFQLWLGNELGADIKGDEMAKQAILKWFFISSRKELDDPLVGGSFREKIMKPWSRSPLNPHRERV